MKNLKVMRGYLAIDLASRKWSGKFKIVLMEMFNSQRTVFVTWLYFKGEYFNERVFHSFEDAFDDYMKR